jgi:geranylgeranyl reductase family protein
MEFSAIHRCDALIVGAGPAGAYLGYLLGRQGVDVAIIDKQEFPRDKVCGGGVSRKAIDLLEFDLGPVVQRSLRGAVLTWRNEAATIKDIEPSAGCTVLRSEFDQFLIDKACTAGARFLPTTAFVDARDLGDSVVVTTDRGEFRCRRLFAADGANSVVRDRVFGKHTVRYVPSIEALVYLDQATLARFAERAVFDFGGMTNGYGWIFPKRDHANVGIYSPFGGGALRRQLQAFISCYQMLQKSVRIDYRGSIIPLCNLRNEYERGRVSLLGDAAGFAEAMFGEGIYFALKSASLAAQAVAESGLVGDGRRYSELLARDLLPELRAAGRIASLLYRVPDFAFRHLVLNERINDDFAGLISGAVGYRRCLVKTLLGFPRWLLPSQPARLRAAL